MAAPGFGTSPFVLPNMFQRPGDALDERLDRDMREQQMNMEWDWRRQRQQEQDEWKKYQLVKDTINPEDVITGSATFNEWSNAETKRVMDEVLSDKTLMTLPFAEMYGRLQQKWQPVLVAANKMKTGLDQIDAAVKLSGTEDTNLATDNLAVDAKKQLIDDIMPIGQDGRRKYDVQNYRPDRDYVSEILGNPEKSWRYVKSADPLIKYIENAKTDEFNPHKILGDQSVVPYKGRMSPFVKPNVTPDATGKLKRTDEPKFEVPVEDDFITEDGKQIPIKLIDKDIFSQHIEKIPANKKSFDFLWNKYKEQNGFKTLNATEEEKRKRAFAVGVFKAHDPSQISYQTPQHLPRNTTNNYIGAGGGGSANLNDVYGRITGTVEEYASQGFHTRANSLKGDELEAIIGYAKKAGKEDAAVGNVFLAKTPEGGVGIYEAGAGGEMHPSETTLITTLPRVGTNLPRQANVAGKKAVVAQGEPKPTTNKKKDPLGLFD
jgi:hypothetical protein